MPYNNITGAVDTASISADGSVYTSPNSPVYIITGASGDKEDDTPYAKADYYPSYTGTENYGAACRMGLLTCASPHHPPSPPPPHWQATDSCRLSTPTR